MGTVRDDGMNPFGLENLHRSLRQERARGQLFEAFIIREINVVEAAALDETKQVSHVLPVDSQDRQTHHSARTETFAQLGQIGALAVAETLSLELVARFRARDHSIDARLCCFGAVAENDAFDRRPSCCGNLSRPVVEIAPKVAAESSPVRLISTAQVRYRRRRVSGATPTRRDPRQARPMRGAPPYSPE